MEIFTSTETTMILILIVVLTEDVSEPLTTIFCKNIGINFKATLQTSKHDKKALKYKKLIFHFL